MIMKATRAGVAALALALGACELDQPEAPDESRRPDPGPAPGAPAPEDDAEPEPAPVSETEPETEPLPEPEPEPEAPPPHDPAPSPDPGPEPSPTPAALPEPWHRSAGDLHPGSNRLKGDEGFTDPAIAAPDLLYPLREGPSFLNSQILGRGGQGYADGEWPRQPGSQNDRENFVYPWRDNFCEVRIGSYATNPLCPGGQAHTGQDIRPQTCANARFKVFAPEAGEITHIGSYSVYLLGDSGYKHTFLHMQTPLPPEIVIGARVEPGQELGRVSNLTKNGTRWTTVHLHYELYGGMEIDAAPFVGYLPPYTSLVEAYRRYVRDSGQDVSPVDPAPISQCGTPQWP